MLVKASLFYEYSNPYELINVALYLLLIVIMQCSSITGISNDETSDRFFKFDNTRYEWIELPHMTVRRHSLALAHHDGYIYAIGGSNKELQLDSVERFDMIHQTWEYVCTLLKSMVYCPRVITLDGQFLIYGITDIYQTADRHRDESNALLALDPKMQASSVLFEENCIDNAKHMALAPGVILMQDKIPYRVWFEENLEYETIAHVNQIEIRQLRNGTTIAAIGRKIDGQESVQDHNEYAFHINGQIYVCVNGVPHKMGMMSTGNYRKDLEGADYWLSSCYRCVSAVHFTIDTNKAL